jgi:phosphoglycolate phosphatase-like HAD superfamily hydrolase
MGTITFTGRFRRLAEQKLRERKDSIESWARDNIKSYGECLAQESKKLVEAGDTARKEVEQFIEALAALKQAGFKVTNPYSTELRVKTKKANLTKLYKAIGRLDGSKTSKTIKDAAKGIVTVSLPSVRFLCVRVFFDHKLAPTDRCHIEAYQVPAKTDYRLVCEKH